MTDSATSQMLDRERRVLAERIVARQYDRQPILRERYGESGRARCVQDVEYHLSYLSVAVAFGSPLLYRDYMTWARTLLAAYGVVQEDVQESLQCLREVVLEELPASARDSVAPFLDAALETTAAQPGAPPPLTGDHPLSTLASRYLGALLNGDRHQASRLVHRALEEGVPLADIYLKVFQPCQLEVGRLWQTRQITVGQEHYCTAATQLVMSQLYPRLFSTPRKHRRVVAASVGGELHEVGLRVVSDLLEADGWDTTYLGANVPTSAVVATIEQQRPHLLLVSATMTFHVPAVAQLIETIRKSPAGRQLPILVGGYPFNVDRALWRSVGADGSAPSADEAVEMANRLTSDAAEGATDLPPAPYRPPVVEGARVETVRKEEAFYAEMSRLNNDLVTAQRELARHASELERANEKLREADRRKDEFLAMLAHELRNPLAPLRHAAHLLLQPGVERPIIERTGAMMDRQVRQLGRLVDDLLDLSRIARGKMQLRRERVELAPIVQRAVDVIAPFVEAREHQFDVALPAVPVFVLADSTRLEQVLTNLLHNAVRYTPAGGRIVLQAGVEQGQAVMRVRDNGIGIPRDMLGQVFGMFAQTGRDEESREGGLGIGLALVKSLTEMHGGSVDVHSEGAGRGSEFIVRWPLMEGAPLRPSASGVEPPRVERAINILLVDDSRDAAESLALLLRLWGHHVAVAFDGPAALRAAERHRPEVALLDLRLPGMDGFQLAESLRPQMRSARPLLVALTGSGQEEDRRRSAAAGFDHHLVKPVELSALRELLEQVPSGPAVS